MLTKYLNISGWCIQDTFHEQFHTHCVQPWAERCDCSCHKEENQ